MISSWGKFILKCTFHQIFKIGQEIKFSLTFWEKTRNLHISPCLHGAFQIIWMVSMSIVTVMTQKLRPLCFDEVKIAESKDWLKASSSTSSSSSILTLAPNEDSSPNEILWPVEQQAELDGLCGLRLSIKVFRVVQR